jgi:phage RecT family recombinase
MTNQMTTSSAEPESLVERLKEPLAVASRMYGRILRGSDLHFARERTFLLDLVRKNAALQECTLESLAMVILQAGSMGLSLNPLLAECYVVPRRTRRQWRDESDMDYAQNVPTLAYASPGYRGLIALAVRSGVVTQMAAEIVFQSDKFRFRGPMTIPEHEQVTRAEHRRFADAIGVYFVARLAAGGVQATYMDSEQIARVRRLSEAPNSIMWSKDSLWTEGWKKAVIRRGWKLLPQSSRQMVAATDVLNRHEGLAEETAEPVSEQQVVPLISMDDTATLRSVLTEAGVQGEAQEKWLRRLADRFGVADIAQLPASSAPAARQLLIFGLEQRRPGNGTKET